MRVFAGFGRASAAGVQPGATETHKDQNPVKLKAQWLKGLWVGHIVGQGLYGARVYRAHSALLQWDGILLFGFGFQARAL